MIYLLIWALAIFVAYRIGQSKDRPKLIWWGILFGWLGVIFAACSRSRAEYWRHRYQAKPQRTPLPPLPSITPWPPPSRWAKLPPPRRSTRAS